MSNEVRVASRLRSGAGVYYFSVHEGFDARNSGRETITVPKTNTGGPASYAKDVGSMISKELCKLAP